MVRGLVSFKRSKEWMFLFHGTNIDSKRVTMGMGMDPGESAEYRCDPAGIREVYRSVSDGSHPSDAPGTAEPHPIRNISVNRRRGFVPSWNT